MKPLKLQWAKLKASPNSRRLAILLLCGLLAVGAELGARAWEQQQKLEQQLTALRKRVQILQESADRVNWTELGDQVSQAQHTLQEQLWHAPTEAQAQAMLRDWLSSTLQSAGLSQPSLRLQPVEAAAPAAATSSLGAETAPQGTGAELARKAVRTRAQIGFQLEPGTLETVLQRIEHGGQLASVDTLSVSKRSRRIEMTVSIPVIIEPAQIPAKKGVSQ